MDYRTRAFRSKRQTAVTLLTICALLLGASASFALAVTVDSYCFRGWGSSTLDWGGDVFQSPTGFGTMEVRLTHHGAEVESFTDTSEPWHFRTETGGVNEGAGAYQVHTDFSGQYGSGSDYCAVN